MAAEPTEKAQHLYAWPMGFNLALLLLMAGLNWPDVAGLGLFTLLLALVNGFLGFVFLLFERRRDTGYTGGFFLSFLLLLLIGFGMCAKESARHREVEVIEEPANTP